MSLPGLLKGVLIRKKSIPNAKSPHLRRHLDKIPMYTHNLLSLLQASSPPFLSTPGQTAHLYPSSQSCIGVGVLPLSSLLTQYPSTLVLL